MLIDPDGLFHGERLAMCSDKAQLHFPRLVLLANGFGRFEIDVPKIQRTAYSGFKKPPSFDELMSIIGEFTDNFLLFIYESNGALWAQWDTSPRLLKRHKTTADHRSPAPPAAQLEAFQKRYIEYRRQRFAKYQSNQSLQKVSETFRNPPKSAESFREFPLGVGVGVGVGVGEGGGKEQRLAPPSATPPQPTTSGKAKPQPDPRHTEFKDDLSRYYSVTAHIEMPWDGSDAKALDNALKASPSLTREQWRLILRHRAKSEANHQERPSAWLRNAISYIANPLNRYGDPLESSRGSPGAANQTPLSDEQSDQMRRDLLRQALTRKAAGQKLSDLDRDLIKQQGRGWATDVQAEYEAEVMA